MFSPLTGSRRALAAAGLVLAAAVTLAARPATVSARPAKPAAAAKTAQKTALPTPSDRWLKGLGGKRRQLFDAPSGGNGIPLVHVLNYYETLNKAYGVKDADIDGVLTLYGATTFYGVSDAMWEKYRLAEFVGAIDPTASKQASGNPWRASPVVLGMSLPQASIEALQKRGATFILCNNALTIFAGLLAKARGLDANAVYADLAANLLPGVELVPGMVVAIEQAHAAGLSYHRQ